jgi:hypothetical protein
MIMTDVHEATVEVLTAEVRVLMVGSRQVTLSVARQLDIAAPDAIEPFGRVALGPEGTKRLDVIGRGIAAGALVRSNLARPSRWRCVWPHPGGGSVTICPAHRGGGDNDPIAEHFWEGCRHLHRPPINKWDEGDWTVGAWAGIWRAWQALPLIVLAGLR